MRAWYMGCAAVCQTAEAGSSPAARPKKLWGFPPRVPKGARQSDSRLRSCPRAPQRPQESSGLGIWVVPWPSKPKKRVRVPQTAPRPHVEWSRRRLVTPVARVQFPLGPPYRGNRRASGLISRVARVQVPLPQPLWDSNRLIKGWVSLNAVALQEPGGSSPRFPPSGVSIMEMHRALNPAMRVRFSHSPPLGRGAAAAHSPDKGKVAGSNPAAPTICAGVVQLAERLPCKQRVGGSSPLAGSI